MKLFEKHHLDERVRSNAGQAAAIWLPALTGPAIIIGLYWLIAWLGKRRLDRQIDNQDS